MTPHLLDNETREIVIGWVIQPVGGGEDDELVALTRKAAVILNEQLARQFPQFEWRAEFRERNTRPSDGSRLDPLELLALGCHEKLVRHWDFAFVVTQADLRARTRPFTLGTPSSALETAVLSTHRYPPEEKDCSLRLMVVAQYLFGHLLGLEPHEPGAMKRPLESEEALVAAFSSGDQELMGKRLAEVADLRLEEAGQRPGLLFRLRALIADPRGILSDVIGYEPWKQPFRLGRLTAAAFVSMLFLYLGAEPWELGMAIRGEVLSGAAILAVLVGTGALYHGQNIPELTRQPRASEQLERTRVVLQLTLFAGMFSLGLYLFLLSLLITFAFPRELIVGWVGEPVTGADLLRFAVFSSTLGTLAGALGGNLEDEGAFQSKLLIDEET
ncbi:hypothetical protein [Roseibacillus ishigakijimensis]|uniref:Uncharacterized protein n=1 Tax=Roseibacillus ishigakijimensis TaxID=454146 RepID=A0A934RTF3_9BACT|nr:hypothetical protein [Roseibacillus ishigakijimensis]MBK1833850.1 hypothetical protein [Roseibacillus ishigakijimensis]